MSQELCAILWKIYGVERIANGMVKAKKEREKEIEKEREIERRGQRRRRETINSV